MNYSFLTCSVPGCEYTTRAGELLCFCHTRGFAPPLTFAEYRALSPQQMVAYQKRIKALAEAK